jgi:hypothetical protein
MILKSLFFIFFALPALSETFPTCPRPANLSEKGALKKLETCSAVQKKFCLTHEKLQACSKFLKMQTANKKEKDPQRDCAITSNGYYRCKPEPVRFVEKTQMPQPSIPRVDDSGNETTPSAQKPKASEPGPEGILSIPPPPPATPAPTPNFPPNK